MSEQKDIHDLIDAWHGGPDLGMELHEFLGLTWGEYGIWFSGGPLPPGGGLYDSVRLAQHGAEPPGRQRYRGRPHRKKARRLAQAELAKLYRGEYMRLLVKYEKLLTEGGAEGGQQDV